MVRTVVVSVLSAALLFVGQPAALAGQEEFGRTWAKDRKLQPRCHDYRYQYVVKSPEQDWNLETFLINPNKKPVGAGQLQFNSHPERGSSTFRLCRNVAVTGKYKIRGKLTYGPDDTVVWIKPGYFRLRPAS